MQKHFKKAALATAIAGSLAAGTSAQATEVLGGELSANIALVSNYYFRGVTQTNDGAAAQGGVDLEGIGGTSIYVGTWASNVDFGDGTSYEIDFYGGWAPSLGDFNFDVGYVYYAYPDFPDDNAIADTVGVDGLDYGELYGSVGWKWFTVGLAYTTNSDADDGPFKDGDMYYYGAVDVELSDGWGVGGHVGGYKFDDDGSTVPGETTEYDLDYVDWSIYVSKDVGDWGTFNLTYVQTDIDSDDTSVLDDGNVFATPNADDPKVWVGWSKGF
jgi:uncharacterized protein (TIGR02001 family)